MVSYMESWYYPQHMFGILLHKGFVVDTRNVCITHTTTSVWYCITWKSWHKIHGMFVLQTEYTHWNPEVIDIQNGRYEWIYMINIQQYIFFINMNMCFWIFICIQVVTVS